jgi:hypothetical protein
VETDPWSHLQIWYPSTSQCEEAYELDAKNGNTKWQDAMKEEIDALPMFIIFIDHGKIPYLEGYKTIQSILFLMSNMIFVIKLL